MQESDIDVSSIETNGKAEISANILQPRDFADKISYAFQLATSQGPLCNEPVQGIAVFLDEIIVAVPSDEESSSRDNMGRLTGEVIKIVRDSIRQGFLDWSPRLLLAMYSCEIQASCKLENYVPLWLLSRYVPELIHHQPMSWAESTASSHAVADVFSLNPSKKAPLSSPLPLSSPWLNPLGLATRSAREPPAQHPHSSFSLALKC